MEPTPRPEDGPLVTRFAAVPATVPLVRRLAVEGAARLGAAPAVLDRVALAVTEAAANVIRHAYPGGEGSLHLAIHPVPAGVCVRVLDEGVGLGGSTAEGGLGAGLALMAACADDLVVERRRPSGVAVRMTFAFGAA